MEHGSGIDLTNHLHLPLRHHHQHRRLIPTTPSYSLYNASTLLDVSLPAPAMKEHVSQVSGDVLDLNINTTFQRTGRFFNLKKKP
jgi:hypothetical protein